MASQGVAAMSGAEMQGAHLGVDDEAERALLAAMALTQAVAKTALVAAEDVTEEETAATPAVAPPSAPFALPRGTLDDAAREAVTVDMATSHPATLDGAAAGDTSATEEPAAPVNIPAEPRALLSAAGITTATIDDRQGDVPGHASATDEAGIDPAKSDGSASTPVRTGEGIRAATVLPTDPMLAQQWHLGNTGGLLDLRVRGAWDPAMGAAYTGAGVRVVVIDDGFDYNHADLAAPYNEGLDFDFDGNDLDPFGTAGDAHGTAVAGIIGADNNGTGVVGVAFDSELVGYRTHGFITDFWLQNIRDSIHHAAVSAQGDVANISQGIANDDTSEWGIGYNALRFDEIETSIGTAVGSGRGGLGMTIVKSAGNSRADNYDVNADDWTNDTRQVVVAAVDQNGFVSSYSSYGAALLVSGFGTPGQVVTTDRTGAAGYNNTDFTSSFNGTSAAAPMVSGVVALIYDADPDLGWRDVQSILALTARHVGTAVGGGTGGSERYAWGFNAADTWNGGGLHFSNDYGYGLVDGLAAVRLAETWLDTQAAQTNGNQFTNTLDMLNVNTVIPDGNATGTSFTGNAGFNDEVERVTVRITFSTTFTADMEIYVTSPGGMVSELIDDVGGGSDFNGTWTFETQAFRGERAAGTWTVRIVDDAGGDVLSVSDIVLTTFGRASSNDRYVFTNEYSDYDGLFGHSTTLTDTNGGTDAIHAEAVTSNSIINLNAGSNSTIDGTFMTIAAGTVIENAYGGDGADTLIGNSVGNRLLGGRGHDSLDGGSGTDSLYGGDGNDRLSQNSGGPNELMDGGAGIDTGDWSYNLFDQWVIDLTAGTANIGATTYAQLVSIENVVGSQSADTIIGNSGGNRLEGNNGNDSIDGGGGSDSLYGGAGNDTLSQNTGSGTEIMDGGAGIDTGDWSYNNFGFPWTISLLAGTAVASATTWATLVSIENVVGTQNSDVIIGNGGDNRLDGHNGDDSIDGGSGGDSLYGGEGNDTLSQNFGGPNEVMDGGNGIDTGDWSYSFSNWTISLVAGTANIGATTFAQLTSIENVVGGQLADTITGDGGNNRLDGQGGNDSLLGGAGGNDLLEGGDGADTLNGGGGFDTALGGNGDDYIFGVLGVPETIVGGAGADTVDTSAYGGDYLVNLATGATNFVGESYTELEAIISGIGNDTLLGTTGNNTILGGAGADTIAGDNGDDRLEGGTEADTLDGGAGSDSLYGGDGNDILSQNFGGPNEVMDGGNGIDTGDWSYNSSDQWVIDLAAGTAMIGATTFAQLVSIENAVGGQLGDTIIGTSGANRLEGRNGNDSLDGGDGVDSLFGGEGNDTLSQSFGSPNEVMDGGNGIDTGDWSYSPGGPWVIDLAAGTAMIGAVTVALLTSIENVVGSQGGDTLIGTTGANRFDGQNGNDSISAGDGADTLIGGAGADTMAGGAGNDYYEVGAGDVASEAGVGNDTVVASVDWTLAAGFEHLYLVGAALNGTGNGSDNVILGNGGANTLNGANGADTLFGGGGNDSLLGGTGADSLGGGAGNDIYNVDDLGDVVTETVSGGDDGGIDEVRSSVSFTLGAFLETLTLIGVAASNGTGNALGNRITGNSAANLLAGLDGADTLDGLGGADTMQGGAGDDVMVVDNIGDVVSDTAGIDLVLSSINYTIGIQIEHLTLTGNVATMATGNGLANVITGNNLANTIVGANGDDTLIGLNGNDFLNGGAGADSMVGGIGADRYVVDSLGDSVTENFGEGNDSVIATVDWTLGDNFEGLVLNGVANLVGTGNALANRITGNSGNNLLTGGGGNDTMLGGIGADTLIGGAGRDVLTGGNGADWFMFQLPGDGVDSIVDFAPGTDEIAIVAAAFSGLLPTGALPAANFVAHGSNATTSAAGTPQFIYNTALGILSYDVDGVGGAISVRLAVLTGTPALAVTDFILV